MLLGGLVLGFGGLFLLLGSFFIGVLPFCEDIIMEIMKNEDAGYVGFEQLTVFLLFIIALLLGSLVVKKVLWFLW